MPSRTTDGDQAPEIPPPHLEGETNAAGSPRVMRRAERGGGVGVRGSSADASRSGTTIGTSGRRLSKPRNHAEGKRRLEGTGIGDEQKGGNEGGGEEVAGAEARPTQRR